MISCILLSAGRNTRFGSPKGLACLDERVTVLSHLQHTLLKTPVSQIIIVLGAYRDRIESHILKHDKITAVYNKDYLFGQTSSFQTGLNVVKKDAQGVMLLPVDYPLVKVETLNKLIAFFFSQQPMILIPTYQSHKGHPPIFSTRLKKMFLEIEHSSGLNSLAHQMHSDTVFLPVEDPAVVQSFNTPAEFENLKTAYLNALKKDI